MTSSPKVSVILTSFNHAKYLREAIDSVLNQTFDDFELIIWDDASVDESWEIIQSYSDPRIKAFRNEEQMRGIYGINKAISEVAKGEYVAIHHSDDVWRNEKLERQVAVLNRTPEISAVFTWVKIIDEHGSERDFEWFNRPYDRWRLLREFFYGENHLNHPSILIRRSIYKEIGIYKYGLAQTGDAELWSRLLLKYEIDILEEALVLHRLFTDGSNTSGPKNNSAVRVQNEWNILRENFLECSSQNMFLNIFPEALSLNGEQPFSVARALAYVALNRNLPQSAWGFGIDLLYKHISNGGGDGRLAADYDYRDLIRDSGMFDVFGKSLSQDVAERDQIIIRLNQKIASLNQIVSEYEELLKRKERQLDAIYESHSWKLTKPLRYFRRLCTGQTNTSSRGQIAKVLRSTWSMLPISVARKRQLKNVLFNAVPFLFRHTVAYKNWLDFRQTIIYGAKSLTPALVVEPIVQFVPLIKAAPLENKPVKLICFYLPQFHSIAENDLWWGKGFTEWTNVQPAKPQFVGHYQPHLPGELGYYNLLDAGVQRRQIELAKLYGIGGFCFYFYWFGGKRLLETPIESYLEDSSLDLPFCLCWANENWSRRWDGLESEILIAQDHSPEDDLAFIEHVALYMRDPRYIRIDDKPLLLVYRPSLLPSAKETGERWRKWCRENGIGDIYLAYTQSFEAADPADYGFDAAIEFPPNNSALPIITNKATPISDALGCTIYDWRFFVERSKRYTQPSYKLFRSVCPSWDNTARRKSNGTIFANSTPELYQHWLNNAIVNTVEHEKNPDERLVFVNAWNEWAEGAHLEPDARYGYAWLQATRNALIAQSSLEQRHILVVTHDCHPHGAQFLALEMIRQLVHLGYKTAIVALNGGKLQAEFERLGSMVVASTVGKNALSAFLADLRKRGCHDAITSTVVSGSILPELKEQGFRVISLIHELPGVIRDMQQESNARSIADLADKVVFPADLVCNQFETIVRVPKEKVVVRSQGLLRKNPYQGRNDAAHNEVCLRHGLSPESKIILNIGYLDHRKGADLFVEVAESVCQRRKDAVFIWVGHANEELEHKVKARVQQLGLEKHVLFVGFDPDPLVYYAAASAYALTSREDPFPNVVLESVAVGTPVVAFEGATGAAEFIVAQGGRLARSLDVSDFAVKLEQLLDLNFTRARVLPDLSLRRYILDLLHHLNGLPRISVIVPNYNYASLIEGRLDSIVAQTYPVYEIIVLDDASTDDSVTRVERYCRDHDAKLLINEVNSGSVFRQWAKGAQVATGDLLWIAEADDLANHDFLSVLASAFAEKNTVLAYSQSRQINEKGDVLVDNYLAYSESISDRWCMDYSNDGMNEICKYMTVKNLIPNVSATLFKRGALLQALKDVGDELFNYRVAGDWLVYVHVLKQGKLFYSAKPLNDHRRHQQSVTSTTGLQNHLNEVAKVQLVAQEMTKPDENIIRQASSYLSSLRKKFGLDDDVVVDRDLP